MYTNIIHYCISKPTLSSSLLLFFLSLCCTSLWKNHCGSVSSCMYSSSSYWCCVLSFCRSAQLPVCREKWLYHWQDPKEKLPGMSCTEVSPGRDEPGRWGVTPSLQLCSVTCLKCDIWVSLALLIRNYRYGKVGLAVVTGGARMLSHRMFVCMCAHIVYLTTICIMHLQKV